MLTCRRTRRRTVDEISRQSNTLDSVSVNAAVLEIKKKWKTLNSLTNLVCSCDKFIAILEQQTRGVFLRQGFLSMPGDIIAYELKLLPTSRDRIYFTSTNGRVRDVALFLPLLWTNASNERLPEGYSACLVRIKNAKLDVTVDTAMVRERVIAFMLAVLPHTQRWKSLKIFASNADADAFNLLKCAIRGPEGQRTRKKALSTLESFALYRPDNSIFEGSIKKVPSTQHDSRPFVRIAAGYQTSSTSSFMAALLAPNTTQLAIHTDASHRFGHGENPLSDDMFLEERVCAHVRDLAIYMHNRRGARV